PSCSFWLVLMGRRQLRARNPAAATWTHARVPAKASYGCARLKVAVHGALNLPLIQAADISRMLLHPSAQNESVCLIVPAQPRVVGMAIETHEPTFSATGFC